MTDKRRKRSTMTSTSHHEAASQDFHVVTIGDASSAPRRRSASAGRSESWMAKVTTAMSHRLFAGRRLSASRSTQVMPMFNKVENRTNGVEDSATEVTQQSRDRVQSLLLVSSEAMLPRNAASFAPDPVQPLCPSVVCDIEEPIEDDMRKVTMEPSKCSVNTIQVRSPRRSFTQSRVTQDKVHPQNEVIEWGEDSSTSITSLGRAYTSTRSSRENWDDEPTVHTTAPILKDFFSRNATTTHREREQQRESRRGQHYKHSKERHNRLREQCEKEAQHQAEQLQREKIERLRRLNQQRRIHMRQEAATLKKSIAAARSRATSRFEAEREGWEQEFQVEIDTLGQAYKRVYFKEGENIRPITVAGLAVPEARSQLQRDAVGRTRRARTAGSTGWSSSLDGFDVNEMNELTMVPIEDSKDVYDVFGNAADSDPPVLTQDALTIQSLLAEREEMARRIAALERQVHATKLSVVVEAPQKIELENGFFI